MGKNIVRAVVFGAVSFVVGSAFTYLGLSEQSGYTKYPVDEMIATSMAIGVYFGLIWKSSKFFLTKLAYAVLCGHGIFALSIVLHTVIPIYHVNLTSFTWAEDNAFYTSLGLLLGLTFIDRVRITYVASGEKNEQKTSDSQDTTAK